jgi:hypothetical protein
VFSASAAAHTDADFALVESEARAGDAVHFSITGAKGQFTYELEIGNLDVVEDTIGTGSITGEFTLPHLGNSQKTATVKAVIRDPRQKTTVTRKLRYLGPALPPPRAEKPDQAEKPAPEPAPAPVPVAQTPASQPSAGSAPSGAPSSSPAAQQQHAVPASRARARHRSRRRGSRHRSTPRLTTSHPSARKRRGGNRRDGHRGKGRTRGRLRPRTAPLFDGVPEGAARGGIPGGRDSYAAPNAIVPVALVSATRSSSSGDGGLGAAILVPGFMGLAALGLAGTALHRRRRLR